MTCPGSHSQGMAELGLALRPEEMGWNIQTPRGWTEADRVPGKGALRIW